MAASATPRTPTLQRVGRGRLGEPREDPELVRLVRDGSRRAFEEIFDRYHRRILAFCRHMLGSREDAEDATQHVFVAAHRELVDTSKDIELRPWLFAIARNRCLDLLRARRATDSLDAIPHEPRTLEGLPEVVQRREDLRALLSDIATLPDDQRAALVLFELGGLPQRSLAQVLDCRPEQVKALVYQARSSLMADRQARAAECRSIREEIASAHGHALLRSSLRRHLRVCPACREFADETRSQRAALALALPVLPTAGLRASTLAAAGAGGAAAVPAGGGAATGLGGVLGQGMALMALAALAVAGAAGGVGDTIVHHAPHRAASAQAQRHAGVGVTASIPADPATATRRAGAQAAPSAPHRAPAAAGRRARHAPSPAAAAHRAPLAAAGHSRAHRTRSVSRPTRRPHAQRRPATTPSAGSNPTSPAPAASTAPVRSPVPSSAPSSSPSSGGHGHHGHHHARGHHKPQPPRGAPAPEPSSPAPSRSGQAGSPSDSQSGGSGRPDHGRGNDGSRPGSPNGHTGAPGQGKKGGS